MHVNAEVSFAAFSGAYAHKMECKAPLSTLGFIYEYAGLGLYC